MELLVVHEAQVVLVDIVFHAEEYKGEDSYIWDNNRENQCNGKGCESIGHMVTQIEGISVNKWSFYFLARLFGRVTAFTDGSYQHVRDIKQPESYR